MPSTQEAPQLRTLERGLQILSLFDVQHPEWSFVEVCRETKLSKATAFRFLKKLEALNYLAYNDQTRTYHLGSSLMRAAYLAASHSQITRTAHPLLEKLAAETGEAANLALATDQGPMIVDAVFAPNAFQPHMLVGMTLRGLAMAHSRVFAAYASEKDRLAALLAPQEKRTDHTITDPQILAEILATVGREGLSYSEEEWFNGACGVAAPVFDTGGRLRASIAIVAPKERFKPEDKTRYATAVKAAAEELTRQLGGSAPESDARS